MERLEQQIAYKKAALNQIWTNTPERLIALEPQADLDLIYSSNALDGNSLTLAETIQIIRQDMTIAGKSLRHHNEVLDHVEALRYVREMSFYPSSITETDLHNIHQLMVYRTRPDEAGGYDMNGRHAPDKLFRIMAELCEWLRDAPDTAATAIALHREILTIRPFGAADGKVARLAMNLILIRSGYPALSIPPAEHSDYHAAVEQAQAGKGFAGLNTLLYRRLDAVLGEVLTTLAVPPAPKPDCSGKPAEP